MFVGTDHFLIAPYLIFISGYSLGRYYMTQTGNLPLEQLTLGWFKLESSLLQFSEHSLLPLKVAGWIFGKDPEASLH